MMFDIDLLRALVSIEALDLTQHLMYKLKKRGISFADVESVIFRGEVIEDYPDNKPDPAALLLGYIAGEPLHVVVALGDGVAKLITAYTPTLDRWEEDYKTRRCENDNVHYLQK